MIVSELASVRGSSWAMALVARPGALVAFAFVSAIADRRSSPPRAPRSPTSWTTKPHLAWANSWVSIGVNAGITIGPVLGGVLVASLGARWVFAANA